MSEPISAVKAARARLEQRLAAKGITIAAEIDPEFGTLDETETWWVQHFEWLKQHGYLLRPRYRPGWQPSWRTGKDSYWKYEDGHATRSGYIMDATRMSDSLVVAMKHLSPSNRRQDGHEESVVTLFSNESHNANPLNHCVRVLDVLTVPGNNNGKILVMVWMREVMDPSFRTISAALLQRNDRSDSRFRSRVLVLNEIWLCMQGLQYMHRNNVAHRDCSDNNMVMDARAMYPRQWHPSVPKKRYDWSGRVLHHSRTRCPPKYYLIDFGFSCQYDPSQPRPLESAIMSGGYCPPEAEAETPCDPFATDVFLLGNMMNTSFLEGDEEFRRPGIHGLEFFKELVDDMMADDPTERPTMDEVASRFSAIVQKQPWWKLRARAAKKNEFVILKPFRTLHHILWTTSMILMLKPAIPCPRP
ncbi:kinase-like domain-containing protein [Rhodocollybia butyracea]|uniref:Kinase-like domain-containing protein n=1 Tax=Rhodocollybia butyracea TaxID=206335 RepID=A0A9P5Q1B4_9AGAR|nr:kinase-like domain-containing protein [Rhodocollybia butyracea]